MSDIRKVWPKDGLTAVRSLTNEEMREPGWLLNGDGSYWQPGTFYPDAEFAAKFVDAAVLSELIGAVRDANEDLRYVGHVTLVTANLLNKALAAFDAAMLPDTDGPCTYCDGAGCVACDARRLPDTETPA